MGVFSSGREVRDAAAIVVDPFLPKSVDAAVLFVTDEIIAAEAVANVTATAAELRSNLRSG